MHHRLEAVGRGTLAVHCHTASVQWTVEAVSCTASQPRGNGRCNSCNALPHYLGAVGNATFAMHCHTAWSGTNVLRCLTAPVHTVVELLQCTVTLLRGSGQRNSGNALPHWPGMWAGKPVHCPAILLGGDGQWNLCNVRAQQLRGWQNVHKWRSVLKKISPAMHCLIA